VDEYHANYDLDSRSVYCLDFNHYYNDSGCDEFEYLDYDDEYHDDLQCGWLAGRFAVRESGHTGISVGINTRRDCDRTLCSGHS
jgi:hypothetical protein